MPIYILSFITKTGNAGATGNYSVKTHTYPYYYATEEEAKAKAREFNSSGMTMETNGFESECFYSALYLAH